MPLTFDCYVSGTRTCKRNGYGQRASKTSLPTSYKHASAFRRGQPDAMCHRISNNCCVFFRRNTLLTIRIVADLSRCQPWQLAVVAFPQFHLRTYNLRSFISALCLGITRHGNRRILTIESLLRVGLLRQSPNPQTFISAGSEFRYHLPPVHNVFLYIS